MIKLSIFRTETYTGKPKFFILEDGYKTNTHPTFKTEERAQKYIDKLGA